MPKSPSSIVLKKATSSAAIFLLQALVVYFATAAFIVPHRDEMQHSLMERERDGANEVHQGNPEDSRIHVVKDFVINPAGTNGTRFLITTIAFRMDSETSLEEIERRDVQLRDALNSVLGSKYLAELIDAEMRDSIRAEIAEEVGTIVGDGKLLNVYFSKYIVQ